MTIYIICYERYKLLGHRIVNEKMARSICENDEQMGWDGKFDFVVWKKLFLLLWNPWEIYEIDLTKRLRRLRKVVKILKGWNF